MVINQEFAFRNVLFFKSVGWSDSSLIYVNVFHGSTWFCILVQFVVCSSVFALSNMLINDDEPELAAHPSMSFMVMYNALMLQGTPHAPNMISKRIIFFFMTLSGLVIFSSYSACLASFLAEKRETLPFTSKESLLAQNNFYILATEGTAYHELLKVTQNGWL